MQRKLFKSEILFEISSLLAEIAAICYSVYDSLLIFSVCTAHNVAPNSIFLGFLGGLSAFGFIADHFRGISRKLVAFVTCNGFHNRMGIYLTIPDPAGARYWRMFIARMFHENCIYYTVCLVSNYRYFKGMLYTCFHEKFTFIKIRSPTPREWKPFCILKLLNGDIFNEISISWNIANLQMCKWR